MSIFLKTSGEERAECNTCKPCAQFHRSNPSKTTEDSNKAFPWNCKSFKVLHIWKQSTNRLTLGSASLFNWTLFWRKRRCKKFTGGRIRAKAGSFQQASFVAILHKYSSARKYPLNQTGQMHAKVFTAFQVWVVIKGIQAFGNRHQFFPSCLDLCFLICSCLFWKSKKKCRWSSVSLQIKNWHFSIFVSPTLTPRFPVQKRCSPISKQICSPNGWKMWLAESADFLVIPAWQLQSNNVAIYFICFHICFQ